MKNLKRVLAVVMVAVMSMSLMACGSKGDNDNKSNGGKEVLISYWNSGQGTAFLDAMIKAFNEKQSDYYVTYTSTASADAVTAAYGMPDTDKVDLYMGIRGFDTKYMTPLDDVLDSKVDGESKTIREKFNANYLDYEKAEDGKVYTLAWGGGAIGIVYNKALFKKAGIETTPRTTGELIKVCDTLYENGITPWTHFNNSISSGGYWEYVRNLWAAQYDGMDYFLNNFYGCKDTNGKSPSKEVFTAKDGRYQVVKEMAKFITPEYVLAGSNSQDHITMQTLFLNQDIAMVVNGSWMANEMKDTGNMDDYGVMKAPVLSAITDKLTTVKSDMELRKLVSAIDEVTEGTAEISKYQSGENYVVDGKEISAADWDYVTKARSSVGMNFPQHGFIVPNYSDVQDGAKEFIKFYYSDEGQKIFAKHLHFTLPISLSEGQISTDDWNSFEKDMNKIAAESTNYVGTAIMSKHKIFTSGGASDYMNVMFLEKYCTNNATDRMTADEVWDEMMKKVDEQYENWITNLK